VLFRSIAIGQATKLSDYLIGGVKGYIFTIAFGSSTTTGDAQGQVLETCAITPDTVDSLQQVIPIFIGKTKQQTPKYSAVKINGIPYYKLARQGLEVPEKIRDIEIFDLKLIDSNLAEKNATYQVLCSKGTYIRTLAADIAKSLQSLGFVIRLSRVSVKDFNIAESLDGALLLDAEQNVVLAQIKKHLLPVESVLQDVAMFDLTSSQAQDVMHGKKIMIHQNDIGLVWLRYQGRILTIGNVVNKEYNIFRNFNLKD
jgi:tRNA pseudouridine55 synthase